MTLPLAHITGPDVGYSIGLFVAGVLVGAVATLVALRGTARN